MGGGGGQRNAPPEACEAAKNPADQGESREQEQPGAARAHHSQPIASRAEGLIRSGVHGRSQHSSAVTFISGSACDTSRRASSMMSSDTGHAAEVMGTRSFPPQPAP